MVITFLSISIAFVVSYLGTKYLLQPHAILNILDHPNERSLHTQPVPRTGGASIFVGIFTAFSVVVLSGEFIVNNGILLLGLGVVIITFISFLDDRYTLGVFLRFLIQLITAGIIVVAGWIPEYLTLPLVTFNWPFAVAVIFTVLFIVWLTNLYNFMDGMDGFAAGMAIIGFTTLSVTGFLQDEVLFSILNGIIASSAAGFLVFNFPPARIFMGDMGSSTLGFLAAVMLLWADKAQIMPLWLGVLLFSPFIVDATVTLVRRSMNGEKFWLPHKTHYYQRLVESGWGHKRTVLVEYALMLLVSITVISVLNQSDGFAGLTALLVWSIIYIILAYSILKIEHSREQ